MTYTRERFEAVLDGICDALTKEAQNQKFESDKHLEDRVRLLAYKRYPKELGIDPEPIPQIFPDIPAEPFGIEVKYTVADTWRCIANSIFEGHKAEGVKHIYIVYGKMGGKPEVRWGRYEECICHVRTSHVPRFEIEIGTERPLFEQMGITYSGFSHLSDEEKMTYVRTYARSRLKSGEHLWWIEDLDSDNPKTVPIAAHLYTSLSTKMKRQVRAEAALLCPEIAGSSRNRKKYDNVPLFLLTYHGIAAHQVRDMFTAGSASHDGTCEDVSLNGNFLACALYDIQSEIKAASLYLPNELFEEYWGMRCLPSERLPEWLRRLDNYAAQNTNMPWVPSDHLKFQEPPVFPDNYSEDEYRYGMTFL